MLTSARAATSLRRSPGTRRLVPAGRLACAGVILARRETRNSRACWRLSTPAAYPRGLVPGVPCRYTFQQGLPHHPSPRFPGPMMISTIRTVDLDGVRGGYRAMADREALKVMKKP